MATIQIVNASQETPEAPVKIQVSSGNIYYQGPKGDTPVKGVDYFTPADIAEVLAQVPEVDLTPYATKTEVAAVATNAATNYATKTDVATNYATKSEVATAISNATSGLLSRQVVQTLPANGIDSNTIYMVPKTGEPGDVYYEYLYVNDNWEYLGSTEVDLTDYATKTDVATAIAQIPTGANYTAGAGVEIENNVISTSDLGSRSQAAGYACQALLVGRTNRNFPTPAAIVLANSQQEFINALKAGFFVRNNMNEAFIIYPVDILPQLDVEAPDYQKYFYTAYVNNEGKALSMTTRTVQGYEINNSTSGRVYWLLGNCICYCGASEIATNVNNLYQGIRFAPSANSGLSVYYMNDAINAVAENLGTKQNQLTAGSNISIVNDTISAVAAAPEYLTNSDVLAIWNGNNE